MAIAAFLSSLSISVARAYFYPHVFQDECGWISVSLAVGQRILKGDLTPGHWDDQDLGAWGDLNPPVGKALIGVPLVLNYHCHPPSFRRLYDLNRTYAQNEALGNLPPRRLLLRARLICCVIAALGTSVAVLVAGELGGGLAALIALLLLLHTPLYLYWSAHAVTDGAYLLSVLLTAYSCLIALRAPERRGYRWLLAASLFAGAGAGVKVTGLAPEGLLIAATLLRLMTRDADKKRLARAAGAGVACLCVVAVTIFALNPSYWIDIRAADARAARAELRSLPAVLREVKSTPRLSDNTALALRQMCPHLYNFLRPLGYPLMIVRWSDDSRAQKLISTHGLWRGPKWKAVAVEALKEHQAFRKEYVLTFVGLAVLAFILLLRRNQPAADASYVLAAYLIGQFVVLLAIPLDFDRYFIPIVVGNQLLCAYAVSAVVNGALRSLAWPARRRGREAADGPAASAGLTSARGAGAEGQY